MSENHFSFGAVSPNVAMIKCDGEPLNIREVVDCLNRMCDEIKEQKSTINSLQQTINELESILAEDIVRKSEIKDAWKQRTEKRWNDE